MVPALPSDCALAAGSREIIKLQTTINNDDNRLNTITLSLSLGKRKWPGTRTECIRVTKMNTEVVRLSGRGSRGVKRTAVVRSIGVQFDSSTPSSDGKCLDFDSGYADQDRKMSGMAPGAATVIVAVMIREDLDCARGLDRGEACQDKQDQ